MIQAAALHTSQGSDATRKEPWEWRQRVILWETDKWAVKGRNLRPEDGNSLHMDEQE